VRQSGIKTVLDQLSAGEQSAFPCTILEEGGDVEVKWLPSTSTPNDLDIKDFVDTA
jgi:hypothetical protein